MQKEEYLIKNACYSVTKYYLCKRNNKRSLSGRKQRLEVVRSFPNRYQFSCINKVTSLFSNRYIFIIIFICKNPLFVFRICNNHRTNKLHPVFYDALHIHKMGGEQVAMTLRMVFSFRITHIIIMCRTNCNNATNTR